MIFACGVGWWISGRKWEIEKEGRGCIGKDRVSPLIDGGLVLGCIQRGMDGFCFWEGNRYSECTDS